MNARERHKAEMTRVGNELKRSKPCTPHYRDMKKKLQRLKKELAIYDDLRGGNKNS